MSALTLKIATQLASQALTAGRTISAAPLTIAVLDSGGHLITLQREDGASLLRPQIAIGKAWGAIALGKGSRLLALDAQQRPAFIAALNSLGQGSVVPAPGGVARARYLVTFTVNSPRLSFTPVSLTPRKSVPSAGMTTEV